MVKTKKISVHLPVVVTGYILFSILVITTLVSTTIPFGMLLFNPKVLHYNVVITVVSLTIGALLPVLLGYSIGDHSVKTKNKLSHHFTGMLFGLLAYWIMILLSVIIPILQDSYGTNHITNLIIMNILPSVGVAAIAAILSLAHMRSHHAKQDILTYKPFSALLIGVTIALPLWSVLYSIATNSVNSYLLVPLILTIIIGSISYFTLRKSKLSTYEKTVWSAVSISVLFVAMFALPQFVSTISIYLLPTPTANVQTLINETGFIVSLLGWGIYWFKQVKTLR